MTTPEQRFMRNWTPAEHIDTACDLLEAIEANPRSLPNVEISLTKAQVHLAIAEAKMHGRGRA